VELHTVEFTAEELPDKEKLAAMLFGDDKDPRSISYKRVLVRPKINWFKIIFLVLLPAGIITAAALLLPKLGVPKLAIILGCVGFFLLYVGIFAKSAVICAIKIYQRYAPDSVRNNCRFEPSCSEYMILAIKKYGLFKGMKKGIGRLKRCNISNGGYDYP